VVSTYIGGVAGAMTSTNFATAPISGLSDVISGRLEPGRVGVKAASLGSATTAWWTAHISQSYTPITSLASGLAMLAAGQVDGVFSTAANSQYQINQGLCSLVVTPDQASWMRRDE
jgi:hypothetical protein